MDKNKNQGQPDQGKRAEPNQQQNLNKEGRKNEPADNNPSGPQQSQTGASPESVDSKKPVTNQDEQRKTTNAGKSEDAPLGEAETEGDKRLKPYKNVGDDSKEVEKKTPTME